MSNAVPWAAENLKGPDRLEGDVLFSLATLLMFTLVPGVLAIAAIVDVFRTGASKLWIPVVLFFPLVGSVAYFVVERLLGIGSAVSVESAAAVQRRAVRRRVNELTVQLAHWRGPGPLTEMEEAQLALGRPAQAEPFLREACASAADELRQRALYALGQALAAQNRYADAVPPLEELFAVAPEFRQGAGPLLLARSLDEAGSRQRAVEVLRALLARYGYVEAQVRLARLLLLDGSGEEATTLLRQVVAEAGTSPPYLRRQNRPWERSAHRLLRGERVAAPLPRPRQRAGLGLTFAVAGGVAAVLLLALLGFGWWLLRGIPGLPGGIDTAAWEAAEQSREQLHRLDQESGWRQADLATLVLTATDVDRYLAVRRALAPHLARRAEVERTDQPRAGLLDTLRSAVGISREIARRAEEEARLLETAVTALTSQQMSPGELADLAAVIEWRFLRREEALPLGLAPYERRELLNWRQQLPWWQENQAVGGDSWRSQRSLEETRQGVEALEERARGALAIAEPTRAVLEARRRDLEALGADRVELLGDLLSPVVYGEQ